MSKEFVEPPAFPPTRSQWAPHAYEKSQRRGLSSPHAASTYIIASSETPSSTRSLLSQKRHDSRVFFMPGAGYSTYRERANQALAAVRFLKGSESYLYHVMECLRHSNLPVCFPRPKMLLLLLITFTHNSTYPEAACAGAAFCNFGLCSTLRGSHPTAFATNDAF